MESFILASKNKGKLKEFKKILKDFSNKVLTMEEALFLEDIEETGLTFRENSMLKAKAVYKKTGGIVIADDSGLEIDALDGKPGIYSARFAGENASDSDRIKKVLKLMDGIPLEKRNARFVCSITVILGENKLFQTEGICEGLISLTSSGENGFGYDPIFYYPQLKKTLAELSVEEKNLISHRGKALMNMKTELKKYF